MISRFPECTLYYDKRMIFLPISPSNLSDLDSASFLFSDYTSGVDGTAASRTLKSTAADTNDDADADENDLIKASTSAKSRLQSYTFRRRLAPPPDSGGDNSDGEFEFRPHRPLTLPQPKPQYRGRDRHPQISFFDDFENSLLYEDFTPPRRRTTRSPRTTRRTTVKTTTTTTTTTTTQKPTTTTPTAAARIEFRDWTPKSGESFGDWVGGVQHKYPTKYTDIRPNFVMPIDVKGTLTENDHKYLSIYILYLHSLKNLHVFCKFVQIICLQCLLSFENRYCTV